MDLYTWKCSCLLPVGMNAKNAKTVAYVSGSRAKCLTQCTLTFLIYSVRYQYQEINYWRALSATHSFRACRRSTMIFHLSCHVKPFYCRIMFEGSWREVKSPTSSLTNHLMLFYLVSKPYTKTFACVIHVIFAEGNFSVITPLRGISSSMSKS